MWWAWTAGCVGYLVGYILTVAAFTKMEIDDREEGVFKLMALVWPLAWFSFALVYATVWVIGIVDNTRKTRSRIWTPYRLGRRLGGKR